MPITKLLDNKVVTQYTPQELDSIRLELYIKECVAKGIDYLPRNNSVFLTENTTFNGGKTTPHTVK
jgi:hypothetical protein